MLTIANDLVENLRPPLSEGEQQLITESSFTQNMVERFEQISRSQRTFDEKADESEATTQNQVPFQQIEQNFTHINRSDEDEKKEADFWRTERELREKQIYVEHSWKREALSDDEKNAQNALELERELLEQQDNILIKKI